MCTYQELIQNADDAGATHVKFLYDPRCYHTQSLLSPDLCKFQGPALYAYNNAKFNENDWEGIQNLMKSNKKDDPLKVGRFGIGFNSVYHITGQRSTFFFKTLTDGRQTSLKFIRHFGLNHKRPELLCKVCFSSNGSTKEVFKHT